MRKPILVVLSHYRDIFDSFRTGVEEHEPILVKMVIRDGEDLPERIPGWTVISGDLPFKYSRNVNLGWCATGNADVILCGDDIRFASPFVSKLQEAAYADPTIGVATVQLHGNSPFVAGLWKRHVLDKVGYMDESFTGYGYDDNDYCHRMELAGYHTIAVDGIAAHHGGGSTFFRRQAEGGTNVQLSCDANRLRYNEKWRTDLK
jgi:GT2 family glycosyltransferase